MQELKEYIEQFKKTLIELKAHKRFSIQIEDWIKAGIYKEKIEMAENILQDLESISK